MSLKSGSKGNLFMALVVDVSDDKFETEVLQASVPVLVDFWAPWCGPCKSIAPMVEEIAKEFDGRVKVVKVNVDSNRSAAMKYNVKHIPNLIIFKGGEVKQQIVGVGAKQEIIKALEAVV